MQKALVFVMIYFPGSFTALNLLQPIYPLFHIHFIFLQRKHIFLFFPFLPSNCYVAQIFISFCITSSILLSSGIIIFYSFDCLFLFYFQRAFIVAYIICIELNIQLITCPIKLPPDYCYLTEIGGWLLGFFCLFN